MFFIYNIREPLSNIAALYDASKKYPHAFKLGTLKKAYNRYAKEISISDEAINKKKHFAVYYEELISNSRIVLERLCENLEIDFNKDMMQNNKLAGKLKHNKGYWKNGNLEIKNKIQERLNDAELEWVKEKIFKLKYSILDFYNS